MTLAYRGILFDLDGTLVDTLDLILASYEHTMRTHLGHVPPHERWLETMGMPLKVQLEDFARSPDELKSMFHTYIEHNQQNHDRLVRPFPAVRETVETLRKAGCRLAVVTSKIRENAFRELRTCKLEDLFELVVSADDVERPKPDPDPVLRALAALGVEAGETILVGDSLHDLKAGRSAGVSTAAALWGPFDRQRLMSARPDYWLENIRSLLPVIGVGADG